MPGSGTSKAIMVSNLWNHLAVLEKMPDKKGSNIKKVSVKNSRAKEDQTLKDCLQQSASKCLGTCPLWEILTIFRTSRNGIAR